MLYNPDNYKSKLVRIGRGPLPYAKPPKISLMTNNNNEILTLFTFISLEYTDAPALNYAIDTFKYARNWILQNDIDKVTFDWDHTLTNYLLLEDILSVVKARFYKSHLPTKLAQCYMAVLEVARPFMHELVLGMIFGFAVKQNLHCFTQWENYVPQVGLATLTWPERLASLASDTFPLLSLIEGTFPGNIAINNNIMTNKSKAFVHLHHFLDYASNVFQKVSTRNFDHLSLMERHDMLDYLNAEKIHHCKPLGALKALNWLGERHVHFDDACSIKKTFESYQSDKLHFVWVRQTQSHQYKVGELDKIYLPALWQSAIKKRSSIMRVLSFKEATRSTMPFVLQALTQISEKKTVSMEALSRRVILPKGVCFNFAETPTVVGDYWAYYLKPIGNIKNQFATIRKSAKVLTEKTIIKSRD